MANSPTRPAFLCTLAPDARRFPADSQSSLLDAALAAGLAVPFSCRRGECGSCRAQVMAGQHERIAPPSEYAYPVQEQELLLCQCRALSDLTLRFPHWQAPAAAAAPRTARVVSLEYVARTIARLVVEVQGGTPFDWQAGQHVRLGLEPGSLRCFSIANVPGEPASESASESAGEPAGKRRLEFHIRRLPGGAFTDRALGTLAPGDTLHLEGPEGDCVWPAPQAADREARNGADAGQDLVLLATGTGFAGVRPILLTALASGACRSVTLYWGNREAEDCYAADWLDRLQAQHPALRWQPVLSAGAATPGRVQDAALAGRHDWARARVYACGHPGMVRDARAALHAAGLPPARFHAEAFVPAAAPRHPWERVGPRFSMTALLEARRRSIEAVNAAAAMLRPGITTGEAIAMIDRQLQAMGSAYNWHPTYVRFGADSVNTWHQPSQRERRLRADDIVVIDVGPVWDGYEGDYGDTFVLGDDADHRRCAQAARAVFDAARQAWLGGMSGKALYAYAETLAHAHGCELVADVPGHRVSEFPHALYGKHRLADVEFVPDDGIWVLEIQVRDRARPIGAFFEDVLVRA